MILGDTERSTIFPLCHKKLSKRSRNRLRGRRIRAKTEIAKIVQKVFVASLAAEGIPMGRRGQKKAVNQADVWLAAIELAETFMRESGRWASQNTPIYSEDELILHIAERLMSKEGL
jgi:hypothetical protein